MRTADVLVVGGGLAGLACAGALSRLGLDVEVLEATARPSGSFRGELLHPLGVRHLKALQLTPALARAVEIDGFAVQCAENPGVALPYAGEGGPGAGFDHPALVAALRQLLLERGQVRLKCPVVATAVYREGERVAGVRAANGEIHRARLVVAADGRHSRLRSLFGLRDRSRLLSYTVVASVPRQTLPDARLGHVLLGAPGPVLAYPFSADQARMCIDVPLSAGGGKERLRSFVLDHYVNHVPGALAAAMARSLEQDRVSATANHSLSVDRCFVPGGVLVGDAGGCSHPLTATGMTSALHDASLLAECVARDGLEPIAIERYASARRPFVRAREAFASALYDVFRGADHGSEALRTGVFRYWTGSERARRASLAILSGEDSSSLAFVLEFTRVCAISAATIVAHAARRHEPRGGLRSLVDMARAAERCLASLSPELLPRWIVPTRRSGA